MRKKTIAHLAAAAALALALAAAGAMSCDREESLESLEILDARPGPSAGEVTLVWKPVGCAESYTVFCGADDRDSGPTPSSSTVRYETGEIVVSAIQGSQEDQVSATVGNLTKGVEHACTVRAHFGAGPASSSPRATARALVPPFASPGACDEALASLDPSSLHLGVADAASSRFSWVLPSDLDPGCLPSFEIGCDQVDPEVADGLARAANPIRRRTSLSQGAPGKRREGNRGLEVLEGLEDGLVYTCSLRAKSGETGELKVQSQEVYVEPGFPKVLRETGDCSSGDDFGLVNQTTMFAKDGCGGAFLLPGKGRGAPAMGLMCSSKEGQRTECYLPQRGGNGGGARAQAGEQMLESVEVMRQDGRGECVPGSTFGFSSEDSMFVLGGCQGQFAVYGDFGPNAAETFRVDCSGDARKRPQGYDQQISRRRWWCLFLCRTQADDPNGFYTCPLTLPKPETQQKALRTQALPSSG